MVPFDGNIVKETISQRVEKSNLKNHKKPEKQENKNNKKKKTQKKIKELSYGTTGPQNERKSNHRMASLFASFFSFYRPPFVWI